MKPSCPLRCACHGSIPWLVDPDTLPAIDAVTACEACVNAHCGVLLERRIWWDRPAPVMPLPAEFCNPEE